jgi:hypothetical protein
VKTGANSSAAMANAATAEFTPSIDRKKGRFLWLFCRKTGVRRKLFNTLLCLFTCFWDSWLFQTLAPQWELAGGRLQNKSYLKTYRRFFFRSGMCFNKNMKVELTGRDEGCGRRAALRDAALLSRSYAIVRGAHVPSPSRNGGAMQSGAILTKAGAMRLQPDCNSWRGIALDCTGLHWIAVNCAKKSLERKTGRKNGILLLFFCLHLIVCKVAEAFRLLALKAQRLDAAATFPGSLMPAPHRLSETLNLVGLNLRQSKLIQVNPG